MRAPSHDGSPAGSLKPSAHDVFKRRSGRWTWAGLMVAVAVHYLVFEFGPRWGTEERPWSVPQARMQALALVDGIEIPLPPDRIARPAPPVVPSIEPLAGLEVAETIPMEALLPPPEIPPPPVPAEAADELAGFQHFMPYMVRPELVNREEVRRALEREYPGTFQSAGIEGAVLILFWIDEAGEVRRYEIRQSSGYAGLDRAAERVIPIMRFRPAVERGEPIRVIVALPIRFETR